jgi:hypothetical protein
MSRNRRVLLSVVTVLLTISLWSGGASARTVPGGRILSVAVFDDQSSDPRQPLLDVLNSAPGLRAVKVNRSQVEGGVLRAFDCVVARLAGPPSTNLPTQATVDALQGFVASGGGYIGEWWGAGAALSEAVPSFDDDYYVPARFLGLFSGGASDGDEVQTDNPVTLVAHHPVVKGLPHVFSGGGGTEFFVRAVDPLDPSLLVVATYEGHGGTNPAIAVGPTRSFGSGTSNAVLLFFDAMDNPTEPELARLWTNSARFACAHQPRL